MTGSKPNTPPGQATFLAEIRAWLDRAERQGAPHVEINSGEIHRIVGGYPGGNHRMPICCDVMYGLKQERDEIVSAPPGGKGASLTIRYMLPR